MVGFGIAEVFLLAMLAGGGAPPAVAYGNPVIALTQMTTLKGLPMAAVAGFMTYRSIASSISTAPPPPMAVPAVPAP